MTQKVVALSGGVGGAKLALGLSAVLAPDELLVVANTGDDFEHLGFTICPDTDTLLYTLGGISNLKTGWGRAGETWSFMEKLKETDPQQAWFLLGDKDLETHNYRKQALAAGNTLTDITADLAQQYAVGAEIVPMSDDTVRTWVLAETGAGQEWLPFQEYFVRYHCEPRIHRIEYRGSPQAVVSPRLEAELKSGDTRAVVVCPSNPFLSIDPILAVSGMVDLLRECGAPIIIVSPVVGGQALKGPTAKIMKELGMAVDVVAIADHYRDIIDGLVIDHRDQEQLGLIQARGIEVVVTNTVMVSMDDRKQLARDVLGFAQKIANHGHGGGHETEDNGYVGNRTG